MDCASRNITDEVSAGAQATFELLWHGRHSKCFRLALRIGGAALLQQPGEACLSFGFGPGEVMVVKVFITQFLAFVMSESFPLDLLSSGSADYLSH